MNLEPLRELEKVIELVSKATPGAWRNNGNTVLLGMPTAGGFDISNCPTPAENTAAIVAAVNFIQTHGEVLSRALAQLDDGWHDIATIPRTGERVLVALEGVNRAVVAFWNGGEFVTIDGNVWAGRNFLAWQPLPSPPAQEPK